ncbi:MAG: alpha/beta hydrolase [Rhodocyclaceae bacterium]|nr:alpha/beta hydrolase [Rhodocyclaceae bacterium]MBX3668744.1 alpha/beta hydrolase [Rhodocyclaceae bacterium]
MNRSRFGNTEVLVRAPQADPRATPLVFIHGAYVGAWCWDEHFLPYFAEQGYCCYALSLPGHGNSAGRGQLDSYGIDAYVECLAGVIHALPAPPVLIGHSMGGMVVQKYIEERSVPAAVLMASVPPHGLLPSALSLAMTRPQLLLDLNSLLTRSGVAMPAVNKAMFAHPIDGARMTRYLRLMQPESHRAIWDMTLFNLPRQSRRPRPSMLVLGAAEDGIIAPNLVRATAREFGLTAEIFDDMGHAMMLDGSWQSCAKHILDWLHGQGL